MKDVFAVLGGGNGSHTICAELKLAGYQVRMYEQERFIPNIKYVYEEKRITKTGDGTNGTATLDMVSTNLEEVIKGASIIIVSLPAFTHRYYADALADVVEDGQIIVIMPGTFGSLIFKNTFMEKGVTADVVFAETNTLPYNVRLTGPGEVYVYGYNSLRLGVLPANRTEEVLERLQNSLHMYKFDSMEDVMACAFLSFNPVLHTPGCILNAGRVERSGGEFYLYEEGVTQGVARVMEALDAERLSIVKKFGYKAITLVEYIADGREPRTLWEEINGHPALTPIKGPTSIKNRYYTEDIPYGLVPWSTIAKLAGIETPVMDGIIAIGSHIIEENAWETGHGLSDFGLEGMNIQEIKDYIS